MSQSNGSNPLDSGEPNFCDECDKSYYEIQRLPGAVGLCPECFEAALNGEQ